MTTTGKKNTESAPGTSGALPQKRRTSFIIATFFLLISLVLLIEVLLRIVHYGGEYDLIKKIAVNGREYYYLNPGVGARYFDKARYFVPQIYSEKFEVEKSPKTFRVMILGESTPAGFPYQYNATPARILHKQLEILMPEKNIEVVNASLTGTNSYTVLDFIEELVHYAPDAIIVYSGHNEFYGALGTASTNSIGSQRWIIRLFQSLRHLRSFILFENSFTTVSNLLFHSNTGGYSGTLMQQLAQDKAISIRSPLYSDALVSFGKNIDQAVQIAEENQIPIILSTIVSNERSIPPFVSIHDPSLTEERKKEIESTFASGIIFQNNLQLRDAIEQYRYSTATDSLWAMAFYRTGQCYDRLGIYDSARIAYGKARDDDGLRFRASSEFNTVIHRIAFSNGTGIADVDSTFRVHSPKGIIDSSLLWEHVHPRFSGYVLLADSWLESLKKTGLPGHIDPSRLSLTITDSMLAERLKITSLDLEIGSLTMNELLRRWPFTNEPYHEMIPRTNVEHVAQMFIKGKLRWNEAHYEMADEYLRDNNIVDALNEYQSVAAMYDRDPFPLMRIGDILSGVRENAQAEKAYIQSLALQENSMIRLKLGIIYLKEQLNNEAIDQFTQAMNGSNHSQIQLTESQFDDAKFYYAVALYKSNRLNEAVSMLEAMIRQHSNNSKAVRLLQEIQSSLK